LSLLPGRATSSNPNRINFTSRFSSHDHSWQSWHLKIQTLQLYLSDPIISFIIISFSYEGAKGFQECCQVPEWLAAMEDEIHALKLNETWELVPRPPATNVVGSKWVFRTKYHLDGSIDRLKARLVAKDYTQLYSLDFNDTFSPVVQASIVRIVLSIAVSRGWNMRQLDVKNAFLYGFLQDVYTEQPSSYVDSSHPNHVCHLKKAIYSLKQAPFLTHFWLQ